MGQSKCSTCKLKRKTKTSEMHYNFLLWITIGTQALIKSLDHKWWWTKLGMEILLQQWGGAICDKHSSIAPQIVTYYLPKNVFLWNTYMWDKRKHFHNTLFVVKTSIWWILKVEFFLWRANQTSPLKKNIELCNAPITNLYGL